MTLWCRLSGNGMAFDRLSALTQLTRLATEYSGGTKRKLLYRQLAQLTGLQELDAPMVLQTQGGTLRGGSRAHDRHVRCCCCCCTERLGV